jgi:hypothetical protein
LSDGLEHGAFDDDTGGHIFPERNKQLSGERSGFLHAGGKRFFAAFNGLAWIIREAPG